MKLRVAAAVLLLLACAPAHAQDKPVEVLDEFVGISFVPPSGAERLSDEERARDFPGPGGRLKVVFDDRGNTMVIMVNVFDAEAYGIPRGSMDDQRQALRQKLESEIMADVPGAQWISRDVIKLNSLPWLHLRYKYPYPGGSVIVMDQYAIVWGERFITLSYSCTESNYERLRADFEKSAASTQLTLSFPKERVSPAGRRGRPRSRP